MTNYCKTKIKNLCGRCRQRCTVLNHAILMEKELGKVCKKVWEFENVVGAKFLFAKYVDPNNKSDETIVTVGFHRRDCIPRYIYI